MAHTRHRKKTLRKALEANRKNRAQRADMRTAVRQARTATGDEVAEALRLATKKLDKAAKHRVIHPKKAARIKSRLAKAQNRSG